MSNWRNASCVLALSLAWAGEVLAQAAANPNAAARAPASPAAAPSPAASPSEGEPVLPQVDDPMLVTPSPAPHILRSWQEALATLRRDSVSLRTARARIERAKAQTRVALSPALPSLTGQGQIGYHLLRGETQGFTTAEGVQVPSGSLPNPALTWNAGLNLRIPLLASSAWYEHGTAKEAVDSSMLDAKEVERQQIALTAVAIVDVVTSERLAEVSRVALGSALSTLNLTKRRAALGAASTVDVLRVEQEVSDSRAQVVTSHENLLRQREALGNALGSAEPWGVAPQIQLDTLSTDARVSCTVETSVDARPDVRAANSAVKVAERGVKAIDYTFVPTVDAVSSLTYWSSDRITQNRERVTWTIGGLLSWNIYDGGLRYGSRAVRSADLEVSRQNVSDVRRRAQIEVSQAIRAVEVANATLAVATRSREIASETARLTRVAYLNGTGTSFDLVDSARRLRAAELDLAIKEFEVLRAKIAALLSLATCHV
jgi:outer membrane protein TolC